MRVHHWFLSFLLLGAVGGLGYTLAIWKQKAQRAIDAAAAAQPEPMEFITAAKATPRTHQPITTAIGTVHALRSITLRNELSGTVKSAALVAGSTVEAGTPLLALDVTTEEAELKAKEAQAALAETLLGRMERAIQNRGASEMDVDKARAEHAVALAEVSRIQAVIARKSILAPFRARVGLSDVHIGQYLQEGTVLTTLQGVDDFVHVDFAVAQNVAAGLAQGSEVQVVTKGMAAPELGTIEAIDARVNPDTRNAMVRARLPAKNLPPPGASVRVRVPVGAAIHALAVPVSALRKGPAGDSVFLVTADPKGQMRAQSRRVRSGTMLGDEVLILEGLSDGDQIAAAGSFKLREGVLVSLTSEGKSAEAAR